MRTGADSRGRGAAVRRPALAGCALALLAVSTTGCAVGGEVENASPQPRAALAERAEVAAKNLVAADRKHPDRQRHSADRQRRRAGPGAGGHQVGAADVAPTTTADTSTAARASGRQPVSSHADWRSLIDQADPVGDQGDGPGYADLTRIAFRESDGRLAVSVDVGSVVPGRLAAHEVEGVGIDFYRSSSDESDYQVYLDGGSGGWRAFLQTPRGFVDFPGTFSLHGRTLDVVIPWSAVGGREAAEVGAFADWSAGGGRSSSDGTQRTDLLPR